MNLPRHSSKLFWLGGALIFGGLLIFVLPIVLKQSYGAASPIILAEEPLPPPKPIFVVTHLPTPEPLKAIYMTSCVASGRTWRENLKNFVAETELNVIVIDIKDYSGDVSFKEDAKCFIKDLKEFIGELHDLNIYAIGRITVFQDSQYADLHPELAVKSKSSGGIWRDYKKLAFIDVGAKPYWDYIVGMTKTGYEMGFDEINFDYIRYPSDGLMSDAEYSWTVGTTTKAEMLETFFSYLHDNLEGVGVKISADLFGQTTIDPNDMGIGQVLERALPYFDYVYPMVYPSHYAWNAGGFGDSDTHPYEIVKYSMSSAVAREQAFNIKNGIATSTPSKLRPWLQDFDLHSDYGVPEVRAQIQAAYDAGLTSWLMWDAGNKYTREAYLPE